MSYAYIQGQEAEALSYFERLLKQPLDPVVYQFESRYFESVWQSVRISSVPLGFREGIEKMPVNRTQVQTQRALPLNVSPSGHSPNTVIAARNSSNCAKSKSRDVDK